MAKLTAVTFRIRDEEIIDWINQQGYQLAKRNPSDLLSEMFIYWVKPNSSLLERLLGRDRIKLGSLGMKTSDNWTLGVFPHVRPGLYHPLIEGLEERFHVIIDVYRL